MGSNVIKYREGYKYQLAETGVIQTSLRPEEDIVTEYINLTKAGIFTVKKGYAWDGCSGPTRDGKTNMRGGLFHDAGYQLLRMGLLSEDYRHVFDRILKELCLEDGMCSFRAWYYFEGVDHLAAFAAKYGTDPYPIKTAP